MKTFRCPFCDYKAVEKPSLYDHMDKKHSHSIPEGVSPAQFYFNTRNKKTHGNCVICGEETEWNESTERYERFDRKECRERYREEFKKRMIDKHGKVHLLNDPDQQKKMLKNRSISGEYLWSDGKTKTEYTGSYEHDFIKFLDVFLGFNPTDVMAPAPQVFYYKDEDGTKRFYIPDFYISSINTLVEIKDGGSNPNMHHNRQNIDGRKEKIKDDIMRSQKDYNFVKVTDKNYAIFLKFLTEIKNNYIDVEKTEKFPVISIQESLDFIEKTILEAESRDYEKLLKKMEKKKKGTEDNIEEGSVAALAGPNEKTVIDQSKRSLNENVTIQNVKFSGQDPLNAHTKKDGVNMQDSGLNNYWLVAARDSIDTDEIKRKMKDAQRKDSIVASTKSLNEDSVDYDGMNNIERVSPKKTHAKELDELLDGANKIWLGTDYHLFNNHEKKPKNCDQKLLENQMKMVGDSDVFIYLGDLVDDEWTDKLKLKKAIRRLKGRKIMILGNNDIFDEVFYKDCGFEYVLESFNYKNIVFSHFPVKTNDYGAEINIHGHLHWSSDYFDYPYSNHADVYSCHFDCKPVTLDFVLQKLEEGYFVPKVRRDAPLSESDILKMWLTSDIVGLSEADVDLLGESFNIDADGTMLISLREKSDFMSKYNTSHRLIKIYTESDNREGVKHELCKLWYMYVIIERYYGKGQKNALPMAKAKQRQQEALKAKAFILNDFTNSLRWVLSKEPSFNFDSYFQETPYNRDVVKLSTEQIKGIKKLINALML